MAHRKPPGIWWLPPRMMGSEGEDMAGAPSAAMSWVKCPLQAGGRLTSGPIESSGC